MVNVIFYNLLRSKYNLQEESFQPGSIHQIIDEVIKRYPAVKKSDFRYAVVFRDGKPVHFHQFDQMINDHETIIITHFVGGG